MPIFTTEEQTEWTDEMITRFNACFSDKAVMARALNHRASIGKRCDDCESSLTIEQGTLDDILSAAISNQHNVPTDGFYIKNNEKNRTITHLKQVGLTTNDTSSLTATQLLLEAALMYAVEIQAPRAKVRQAILAAGNDAIAINTLNQEYQQFLHNSKTILMGIYQKQFSNTCINYASFQVASPIQRIDRVIGVLRGELRSCSLFNSGRKKEKINALIEMKRLIQVEHKDPTDAARCIEQDPRFKQVRSGINSRTGRLLDELKSLNEDEETSTHRFKM